MTPYSTMLFQMTLSDSKIFNDKRDAARVALNLHWLPVESRILQYFDLCSFIALAYRYRPATL